MAAVGTYVANSWEDSAPVAATVDSAMNNIEAQVSVLDKTAATGGKLRPTGWLAESVPRSAATLADTSVLATAQLFMVAVWLPQGLVVSKISVLSGTTALSVGANQWFALFDSSRNKLAVTADDTSTAWTANTVKTLTLSAPFTTTYAGLHYIGIMVKATTPPTLIATASSSVPNGLAPIIAGTADGTLTNPASCPATATAITATANTPFCGVQ